MKGRLRNGFAYVTASVLLQTGAVRRQLRSVAAHNFVTSVLFHNPSAGLFEACVRWLAGNGYHFISVDELYDVLTKASEPPARAICLSVDDGWADNLLNVVPLMNGYRIPVCFFLAAGPVEDGVFWWTYAERGMERGIGDGMSVSRLKALSAGEMQEEIAGLKSRLSLPREAMTPDDVRALAANPLVTIGSHTVSHPCLNRCTPREQAYEAGESKRLLSEWTQKEVLYFSYPNGDAAGVDEAILRESGYRMAFTTAAQFLSPARHDLFHLPRFAVNEEGPLEENICKMIGSWQKVFSPKWEGK